MFLVALYQLIRKKKMWAEFKFIAEHKKDIRRRWRELGGHSSFQG